MMPAAVARELLFPRRCPVCDRPVRVPGELICPECAGKARRVQSPVCLKCGKPLRHEEAEYCHDCRRQAHIFRTGCAAFVYRSIQGAIYRFKFEGRAEYADWFGREMAGCILRRAGAGERGIVRTVSGWSPAADRMRPEGNGMPRPDLLIPVPSSAKRVRRRGYNQAELLSRVVSDQLGIPQRSDILVRTCDTPFLKGLDDEGRRQALKNAFLVYGNDVESKCIMLIDDIYTTGSTMDACADQLYRAGAGDVVFCTLAIGESGYD